MIPRDKLRKAAPFVKAACDHRYRMNVCKSMLKQAFDAGVNIGKMRVGGGVAKDLLGNYHAGVGVVSPSGSLVAGGNATPRLVGNTAIGAGVGAIAGLVREKLKGDDKKKRYLKSLLLGALYGGGAGAAGTMMFHTPDYSKKIKKLVKRGQEEPKDDKKIDYKARRKKLKLILGAIIGGLYGTGVGAASGPFGRVSGKGALVGGLLGTAAGTGLAHASNKITDYAGLDPLSHGVISVDQLKQ